MSDAAYPLPSVVPIPPERFACIVLPDTAFVMGLDGLLYCDECFEVLWPDAKPRRVTVTDEDRVREWESSAY